MCSPLSLVSAASDKTIATPSDVALGVKKLSANAGDIRDAG